MLAVFLGLLHLLLHSAHAYIPAVPTNDTSLPVFNTSSLSNFQLRWQQMGHQPMGGYSTAVSYQLAGEGSNGVTQGAIVHFTEQTAAGNATTTTPWIAFVSCDANDTDASMEEDIFTMAQQAGAVSALLYSKYSQACLINAEYLSPEFDKLIDVFATTSQKTAGLIESQFEQVNSSFYYFDATLLNATALFVNESLADQSDGEQVYLVAQLHASNATGNATTPSTSGGSSSSSGGSSQPNTGLAMIILYAITGCVSVLFCIVILSGAVRAIRHPERYGPRADPGYLGGPPPQTRTAGLARAILDTFPVIKFASGGGGSPGAGGVGVGTGQVKDIPMLGLESGMHGEEDESSMKDGQSTPRHRDYRYSTRGMPGASDGADPSTSRVSSFSPPDISFLSDPALSPALHLSHSLSHLPIPSEASTSTPPLTPADASSTLGPMHASDVPGPDQDDPSLGHETCPICLTPFEDGEDLRVLPCNGHHRFHKDCVDPWLLSLATSCPLCREDFASPGEEPDSPGREGEYLELPVPQSPPPSRRPPLVGGVGSGGRLSRLFGGRRPSSTVEDRERERERERQRQFEREREIEMEFHEQVLAPHPLA